MNRIIVLLIIALMLAPLYFMIIGSFQDLHGIFATPPNLWPKHPTIANYRWVLSQPLLQWARNTLFVVCSVIVLAVIICSTGGYCFAFYHFPAKRIAWAVLLAGIMVPRMSMIIPLFIIMRKLGISGTIVAAILPVAYMPVGLYLSRAYFETVPKSLLEAARLDGAGESRILAQIVAPISRPIVTTVALFAGIGALNDFLWQMLQLQKDQAQTLLIGLIRATMKRGGYMETAVNPVGLSLASAVVLAVPLLTIFLVANRYFVSALGGAIRE